MDKKLDCTNLQCPSPVLQTKALLETYPLTHVEVVVDNDAAVENVSRFLNYNKFEISVDSDGQVSTVIGDRSADDAVLLETDATPAPGPKASARDHQKIMVLVSSATIGNGDDELGAKLMGNFLGTLKEMGSDLWQVVFVNHGVMLCTKDSDVLEALNELEASGVTILACGACLTHLGLMDEKAVGETTNMLDIVTGMQLADKVVNL